MGKNDAVDRMMSLATEKTAASRETATNGTLGGKPASATAAGAASDAAAVLEARVVATEPGVPEFAAARDAESAEALPAAETALGRPHASPGERGRQLLGALRPFLPVVGGALRMIDHGAVQAVARLLPLLGAAGTSTPADRTEARPAEAAALADLLTGLDKQQSAAAEALKAAGQRMDTHEEQLRRVRETAERAIVEQGTLSHRVNQLTDRSRLLTAAVLILLMLVVAQMVLLFLFLHR